MQGTNSEQSDETQAPETGPYNDQINVNLTSEQKARAHFTARFRDMSLSEYIRCFIESDYNGLPEEIREFFEENQDK